MRRIAGVLAALCLTTGIAAAADPTGEWLVADKVARIKIENCKGAYWGVISWEKDPGKDSSNPDAAKRSRPTLGIPILLGMKPKDGKWEGKIYNAENGKTYEASISLTGNDVLDVRGCVMGFLCGGEKWTRVKGAETTGRAAPPPGAPAQRNAAAPAAGGKSVCSAIGT